MTGTPGGRAVTQVPENRADTGLAGASPRRWHAIRSVPAGARIRSQRFLGMEVERRHSPILDLPPGSAACPPGPARLGEGQKGQIPDPARTECRRRRTTKVVRA